MKGKVITTVPRNTAFYVSEYNRKGDWMLIDYKDKTGYMHISRIQLLHKLKHYNSKKISINVVTQPFDKNKHKISYKKMKYPDSDDGYNMLLIDGKKVWGTDGDIPKNEVKSVTITINGKKIVVDPSVYSGLYRLNNHIEFATKIGDTYFIKQSGSDGAGGYHLLWIVSKKHGVSAIANDMDI